MKSPLPTIGFILAMICILPIAAAESIYTWIDKNGVKQFSNEPPPANIEKYQRIEGAANETRANQNSTQQRRRSYDTMVDQAEQQAQKSRLERENTERIQKAEKQRAAEKELEIKAVVEQIRLKGLLKKAQNRGLSKTYSQGMRQNKIDSIQKQLDLLEESPQTYFNNKGRQDTAKSTTEKEKQSGY